MYPQLVPPMVTPPPNIRPTVNIECELGRGAFGVVYLMNICMPNQQVYQMAVKEIKYMVLGQVQQTQQMPQTQQVQQMQRMQQEMAIMKGLNHGNIVKFYDGYQLVDRILLLLEYCDGRDLRVFLKKQRRVQNHAGVIISTVPRDVIYKFGIQIASALNYLHQRNIIHRDIKPENLLLTSDNNIKVTDFGISRVLNSNSLATKNIGTDMYMAPEIKTKQYGFKVDSWSFGCVLYEMMYLCFYYQQPTLRGYPDDKLCYLVSNLLVVDDTKRWSMSQALTKLQEGVTPSAPGIPVLPYEGVTPLAPGIPVLPYVNEVLCALQKYYEKLYAGNNMQ